MKCPACQTELPDQARFCFSCGAPVSPAALGQHIASTGDHNINVAGPVQGGITVNVSTLTSPDAGQPRPSADHRLDYLNALVGDCNRLRLSGLDPTASDPTRARPMTLDQVYVALDTRSMRSEFEREEKPDDALSAARLRLEREQKPLSALEAISRVPDRRAVLLGQPGSGKSTLARYLALRLAQSLVTERPDEFDWQRCLPGWERGPLLPVVVSLGRLAQNIPAEAKSGSAEMVLAYLRSDVPKGKRGTAQA